MLNLVKKPMRIITLMFIFSCLACILFTACADGTDTEMADAAVTDNEAVDTEINAEPIDDAQNTEPAKSREEIEAEQSDTRITDIEFWDILGYSKDHPCYIYIKAFLEGDTAVLEELAWIPAGAYDEYKTIKLDKNYSINKRIFSDFDIQILFDFTVIESEVEYFPVGEYSMLVSDGPPGMTMYNMNDGPMGDSDYSGAFRALNSWLAFGFTYLLPDYDNLDDEEKAWYNSTVSEYIFDNFADEVGADKWTNRWTPAMLQSYAEKYFGIENFPDDAYPMDGGIYDLRYMAHCLHSWYFKYIGETAEDDITTVTLQFFADGSKTIKSHTVEYKLQDLDGNYKFLSSAIIYEALYEPKNFRM